MQLAKTMVAGADRTVLNRPSGCARSPGMYQHNNVTVSQRQSVAAGVWHEHGNTHKPH
jgi:hypothetical protein